MKTKDYLILALIILISIFFRFYQLGSIPNAYTPDELAQGYTAYSILQTGQDEWGSQHLFLLKSFGDYKLPLQTWLMIPSVKLFGLTPFAVRFPNALFSSLSLITVFLFVLKFSSNKKIAFITISLLSVSPWFLPMSRLALEANLTVFFLSLGSYLLLAFPKNLFFQLISAFVFSLNLLTYHSAKLFTPVYVILLIAYLVIITRRKLKSLLPFLFTFITLAIAFFTLSTNNSRSSDIALFNPTDKWVSVSDSQYSASYFGLNPIISRLFNNKATYLLSQFSKNYFSVFSPQFLLTQGAGETTYGMIPGLGVLGLVGFIGFLLALYLLTQTKYPHRLQITFFFLLILIGAFPASIAKSNYSANRLSVLIPFIQIISAYGISYFLSRFKNKIFTYFTVIIFLLESFNFLQTYFYQSQTILAEGMLYGHQQANLYISQNPHSQVIYSRKLSEPQAYVMFFQKIPPQITQQHTPSWAGIMSTEGQSFVDQIGEYRLADFTFRELNLPSDRLFKDTILVGRPDEIPVTSADYVIYSPNPVNPKPIITIYNTSLHPQP